MNAKISPLAFLFLASCAPEPAPDQTAQLEQALALLQAQLQNAGEQSKALSDGLKALAEALETQAMYNFLTVALVLGAALILVILFLLFALAAIRAARPVVVQQLPAPTRRASLPPGQPGHQPTQAATAPDDVIFLTPSARFRHLVETSED